MPTVAELTVAEEVAALRENAAARGWQLRALDAVRFHLTLPAKDKSEFYLLVDCNGYPVQPPAWDWCDAAGARTDRPADKPRGSGFCTTTALSAHRGIDWRIKRLIPEARMEIGVSASGGRIPILPDARPLLTWR